MNLLQALFQRAGLPTDIGRLEREKAEKIAAFKEVKECTHPHIERGEDGSLHCTTCMEEFVED